MDGTRRFLRQLTIAVVVGLPKNIKLTANFIFISGADVNGMDWRGNTALMVAAEAGHIEIVNQLLSAGADMNTTNATGGCALSKAARNGSDACIRRLVDTGPDVNTALLTVTNDVNEYSVAIEKLMSVGANVNVYDSFKRTPLIIASKYGNVNAVNLLLTAGADVNVKDKDGKTALIFASERCELCLDMLIQAGADVNAKDKSSNTALTFAVNKSHRSVEILLKAGADVNATDLFGVPLLSRLCQYGRTEYVKLLINARADVNREDPSGLNPMIHSVQSAHKSTVELLVGAGSAMSTGYDMNAGTSVNIRSIVSPFTRCVRLLLCAGAKVKMKSSGRRRYFLHPLNNRVNQANEAAKLMLAAGESDRFGDRFAVLMLVPGEINLKQLCREAIRKHLLDLDPQEHLFDRVPRLGLPRSLASYLLYNMSLDESDDDDDDYNNA